MPKNRAEINGDRKSELPQFYMSNESDMGSPERATLSITQELQFDFDNCYFADGKVIDSKRLNLESTPFYLAKLISNVKLWASVNIESLGLFN